MIRLWPKLYFVVALRQYRFEKFMKSLAIFAALILSTPVFARSPNIDFLQRGRDFTNLFYDGKTSEIWTNLSPSMKKVFTEEDAVLGFQLQVKKQYGAETAVTDEHVLLQGELIEYDRMVTFQKSIEPILVQWTFDRDGAIVGFFVRSQVAAESSFLDYQDKAALRLPFKGDWLVLSGAWNSTFVLDGPFLLRAMGRWLRCTTAFPITPSIRPSRALPRVTIW
jgi:hypothetical protein